MFVPLHSGTDEAVQKVFREYERGMQELMSEETVCSTRSWYCVALNWLGARMVSTGQRLKKVGRPVRRPAYYARRHLFANQK